VCQSRKRGGKHGGCRHAARTSQAPTYDDLKNELEGNAETLAEAASSSLEFQPSLRSLLRELGPVRLESAVQAISTSVTHDSVAPDMEFSLLDGVQDESTNDGNPHDRVGSDIEFSLLDGVHDERMNDGNPHDRVGPDMEFSLLDGVHDERRINGNPHDRVGLDMEFSLLDGVHDDRILRTATNDSGLQDELG